MAGKTKKYKYGHFMNFIEWRRHGARRIRPEFVPSLCAWLWMIAKEYEHAIAGYRVQMVKDTVPGAEEAIERLEVVHRHIQLLINRIPENFHTSRWEESIEAIAKAFGLTPTSDVIDEPPVQLLKLIEGE